MEDAPKSDAHGIICRQKGCDSPASHRFTWPGKDESYCCIIHATPLLNVAGAIGMHLQLVPLTVEDHLAKMEPVQAPNE